MGRKIGHGAEAVLYRHERTVIKDRVAKRYRHPVLDAQLREQRTRYEERLLKKAGGVIPVPKVLNSEGTVLEIEFIDGELVKELLDKNPALAEEIGENLAKLHQKNIIHGDLTTSNMIFAKRAVSTTGKASVATAIHFIDFGLAVTSQRDEDKAVDIHLFKQALESKHYRVFEKAYRRFLKGYRNGFEKKENCNAILDRLQRVEARGRNKTKV